MRTKFLLFIAVFSMTFFVSQAQTLLVEEEISSQEWEEELLRLNPGLDEFGIPINPNTINPVAYQTPLSVDGKNAGYNDLNKDDLYFGKYRLEGAIEVIDRQGECEGGLFHLNPTTQQPVAFRLANPGGKFEIIELPSVGTVTIHVLNGNAGNDCNLVLEKYISAEDPEDEGTWEDIHTFLLRSRNTLSAEDPPLFDEVLSFDVNSPDPMKIRLHNYKIGELGVRFINLYRITVTSYETGNAIAANELQGIKQIGRKLILPEPMQINIYNTTGSLVFQRQGVAGEFEIPTSIGNGVFILKTDRGNQKILL